MLSAIIIYVVTSLKYTRGLPNDKTFQLESLKVINLNCDKNFCYIILGNDNFAQRKLCYCVKRHSVQLFEMNFILCCKI